MFGLPPLEASTIVGFFIVILALSFLRFGNQLIDLLVSYRSSPVEAVEDTFGE